MVRKSRLIKIGGVPIGGGLPPVVQGMVKSDPLDVDATVKEIYSLKEAGAKIVRVAVPNLKAAKNISLIKEKVDIPLAADIHFNYRLAFEAIDRGIDKVRVNPGNLSPREILLVASKAKEKKIPLRVGVNSGSLPKSTLERILKVKADKEEKIHLVCKAMIDVALGCVSLLEENGFEDIVVSLKSSEVPVTILSNKIIAGKISYPLHLGVTATGPPPAGIIKSVIGIGALLSEGIGDTIRVSLTASSVEEVKVAYQILEYLDLIRQKPTLISCPTCGRSRGDVLSIAAEILKVIDKMHSPIKVAVMGCEVNGPGEAQEADIGIACTRQGGVLFKNGHLLNKVKKNEIIPTLVKELRSMEQSLGS
ncbi:flavodoxin-dependent (E)-4-hydroxy-3-methylbut-2-enyl-diphosphate synthase [Candidatus Aerophobetes bacterium]|nr:flavodoxin-dependent (E)-4-hydroxy-3-methylbut-2-enyl-diphosphate synthase [Candidatus Aerophobetes bacterium]